MLPFIYKPTRETDPTTTLADNIFTNNCDVNGQFYQGIFLMDKSDNYGFFTDWINIVNMMTALSC